MGHEYEERPQENMIILRPLSLITKGYVHWAAAIMIRLENAFAELQREQREKMRSYREEHNLGKLERLDLLGTSDIEIESRVRRLTSDVILGYDSNIPERKKADPDTYAAEVRRAESARLSVQIYTDEILEEVGKHWMACHPEAGFTKPPIFVVPVIHVNFSGDNYCRVLEAHSFLHTQKITLEPEESELDKVLR